MKKIIIGADHAGFEAKEQIKKELGSEYEFIDVGTNSTESVDYPIYAEKVAQQISINPEMKGVLVCGSATGMVMVANKIPGIRAAVGYNKKAASLSREHNNANIISVPGREKIEDTPTEIVKAFLETEFSDAERHQRRVDEIMKIEAKNLKNS